MSDDRSAPPAEALSPVWRNEIYIFLAGPLGLVLALTGFLGFGKAGFVPGALFWLGFLFSYARSARPLSLVVLLACQALLPGFLYDLFWAVVHPGTGLLTWLQVAGPLGAVNALVLIPAILISAYGRHAQPAPGLSKELRGMALATAITGGLTVFAVAAGTAYSNYQYSRCPTEEGVRFCFTLGGWFRNFSRMDFDFDPNRGNPVHLIGEDTLPEIGAPYPCGYLHGCLGSAKKEGRVGVVCCAQGPIPPLLDAIRRRVEVEPPKQLGAAEAGEALRWALVYDRPELAAAIKPQVVPQGLDSKSAMAIELLAILRGDLDYLEDFLKSAKPGRPDPRAIGGDALVNKTADNKDFMAGVLDRAIARQSLPLVTFLLQLHADPNRGGPPEDSPVSQALKLGNVAIAEALVAGGARLTWPSGAPKTACPPGAAGCEALRREFLMRHGVDSR